MAQWRERSPPTNVAQVRFRSGATYGLSLLMVFAFLRRFYSEFSSFPPSTKTNTPSSNSTRIEEVHKPAKADVASSLDIVIYLFFVSPDQYVYQLPGGGLNTVSSSLGE